jgi:hypothetical protein
MCEPNPIYLGIIFVHLQRRLKCVLDIITLFQWYPMVSGQYYTRKGFISVLSGNYNKQCGIWESTGEQFEQLLKSVSNW